MPLKPRRKKPLLVSKTLETPEGTVKFEGELSQEEADFILKVGLLYLLKLGSLPVSMGQKFDD